MYYWNIRALKQDLIHNRLSQRAVLIYIGSYLLLAQLFIELSPFLPHVGTPSSSDLIRPVLDLVLLMAVLLGSYRANGGSQGQYLAERLFSIGFVVSTRALVVLLPVLVILVVAAGMLLPRLGLSLDLLMPITNTTLLLWGAVLVWRIIVHVGDVARTPPNGG